MKREKTREIESQKRSDKKDRKKDVKKMIKRGDETLNKAWDKNKISIKKKG